MVEKELFDRILDARQKAIDNSDKRLAETIESNLGINSDHLQMIMIILLIITSIIILSLIWLNKSPESTNIVKNDYYIDARAVINKGIVRENVNITTIEKHEHTIKADGRMHCIGPPNGTKMTCYKGKP